jgi:hypothetical protein
MTMHLAHPALTTTGKKKGKKKWASAEHKRKAELALSKKEEMYREYNITPRKRNKTGFMAPSYKPTYNHPSYVDSKAKEIPSLQAKGGLCSKIEPLFYTGTRLKGIAVLHKSCLQPVFSQEEATEVARMRR